MAEGVWPSTRHDGSEFGARESWRAAKAGERMKLPAVLVHIKGDWAEFCERLCFPTWASGTRPCFLCAGSGPELYRPIGVSAIGTPWACNQDSDYDDACRRCEVWVEMLNAAQHERLKNAFRYDKRAGSTSNRGRCLVSDIPELSLRTGDRLEPCTLNPDIGKGFDNLSGFPRKVLFCRVSNETLCFHRCPLFDVDLGITPTRSVALDLLHTLHLGVLNGFAAVLVWILLQKSVWGQFETTESEKLAVAVIAMRAELWFWMKQRAAQNPGENLTKPTDLSVKMLHAAVDQKLNLKGAETWTLFVCLLAMVEKYMPKLGEDGPIIFEAGEKLRLMLGRIKSFAGKPFGLGESQDCYGHERSCTKPLCKLAN